MIGVQPQAWRALAVGRVAEFSVETSRQSITLLRPSVISIFGRAFNGLCSWLHDLARNDKLLTGEPRTWDLRD